MVTMLATMSFALTACSDEGSKEVAVTAQGKTEKCEIISSNYRSGEGYNCGTFFLAIIRDVRPSALTSTPDYTLIIKSSKSPNELRVGEVISDSYLSYYNYSFANNGLAKSKEGSVVVKKKTSNKITLDFKNFNFLVDPTDERFGLDGTITFSYKE